MFICLLVYLLSWKFFESRDDFHFVCHSRCPLWSLEVVVIEKIFMEQMTESTFWSHPTPSGWSLYSHRDGKVRVPSTNDFQVHSEPYTCCLSKLNFLSLPSKCFSHKFKDTSSTKSLIPSLAPHDRSLDFYIYCLNLSLLYNLTLPNSF